jgi:hypothetical protein
VGGIKSEWWATSSESARSREKSGLRGRQEWHNCLVSQFIIRDIWDYDQCSPVMFWPTHLLNWLDDRGFLETVVPKTMNLPRAGKKKLRV